MDDNNESRNPRSGSSNTLTYTVTIYRTNSETSVCTDSPMHDDWGWPAAQIDHVHIEKVV